MTTRLQCVALSGGHGTTVAFRAVDLEVESGEILALLGPNGAGKTSLLLTLAGLLPSTVGEVTVNGQAIRSGRARLANRAGVVLVPDNRCLFPSLTVEENLKVGARRGLQPRDMLEVFPALERRWTVKAGAVSGGEQQMLAMARALIQRPQVLLADELSMGLAPLMVKEMFAAIRRIADEHGCAVVLVEQHIHLALEIADLAVVLNHGQIVLRDRAASLRHTPEMLEAAYLGAAEYWEQPPADDRAASRAAKVTSQD